MRAPAAAAAWRPGQFFRIQNFEALAPRAGDTQLAMEGIAAFPASVDREKGLVGLVLTGRGGSANLASLLEHGQSVALMGPNGAPVEVPAGATALLAGADYGVAALLPLARVHKERGNKILFFAAFDRGDAVFLEQEVTALADLVVWVTGRGPAIAPKRAQDKSFVGELTAAIAAYGKGALGAAALPLAEVEYLFALGPDELLGALAAARHGELAAYLKQNVSVTAGIAAPMQCMMKEFCDRCFQPVRDPKTGAVRIVFACADQNMPVEFVDFAVLRGRLGQNSVQEKLTRQWIAHCLGTVTPSQP